MVIIKLLFTALNPLYLERLSVLITVSLVTAASRNSWREQLLLLLLGELPRNLTEFRIHINLRCRLYKSANNRKTSLCPYSRCSSKEA